MTRSRSKTEKPPIPSEPPARIYAMAASIEQAAHELRHRFDLARRALHHSSITHACIEHGLTRGQFARFRKAYERGGDAALFEAALRAVRRHPEVRRAVEMEVLVYADLYPAWGRFRLTRVLHEDGIDVTPRQVARVLRRVKLQ